MPDATELLSLANLKVYLQITSAGSDAILTDIKDFVEDWAKGYVGRDLLVTSYTRYRDGDGTAILHLDHYPITAITSIHSDPTRGYDSSTEIVAANIITNDTEGWAAGIVELYEASFLRGKKNIKVVYSAGYSTVPQDIQFAIAEMCAKVYMVQDKRLFGQISQQIGDRNIALDVEMMPKRAMDTLNRYRRIIV